MRAKHFVFKQQQNLWPIVAYAAVRSKAVIRYLLLSPLL